MKAPETIFLHGYSFDDEPCKNWTLEPLNRGMRGYTVQNVEYIRKDALLEWAKEKREQMKNEAGGCSNMMASGKYLAYSELIEKIESL